MKHKEGVLSDHDLEIGKKYTVADLEHTHCVLIFKTEYMYVIWANEAHCPYLPDDDAYWIEYIEETK